MSAAFTLLDADEAHHQTHELDAHVSGEEVRIPEAALAATLGWKLDDAGLCRGDVCVPVRDRATLADARGIDLRALADLLDRPLALDAEARAAALGTGAEERRAALEGTEAPDFRLPDLEGKLHALSEHRGKKVLLIAYASW